MVANEELFNLIEGYYKRILRELRLDNRKEAERIMYKEMSRDIYDISLDLLFQANNQAVLPPKTKKLFYLIDEVDNLMNPKETQEDDNI